VQESFQTRHWRVFDMHGKTSDAKGGICFLQTIHERIACDSG
jgi:hypothetical protein